MAALQHASTRSRTTTRRRRHPGADRQNIDRVGRVVDAVHHPIGTQGAAVRPAPTTVVMNPAEVVEHHAGADTVVVVAKDLKHDSSECCLDLGPDVS